MKEIPIAELKELIEYNPETGVFTNKVRRGSRALKGEPTGHVGPLGYIYITIKRKNYLAHRVAWALHYGEQPAELDHINCDRSDNRISNLRETTHTANVERSSGRGYSFNEARGTFNARIRLKGKLIHLGAFKCEEEARAAYLAAKAEHHPA